MAVIHSLLEHSHHDGLAILIVASQRTVMNWIPGRCLPIHSWLLAQEMQHDTCSQVEVCSFVVNGEDELHASSTFPDDKDIAYRCGDALAPSGLDTLVGAISTEAARVGEVDGRGGGCCEGGTALAGFGVSSSSVDGKNSVDASNCASVADCARLGDAIYSFA